MIIKTEAIVLRTVDFSETSQIATLFTRAQGIIAVIAKGARRPKSKFAAFFVPGQVLEVVYYHKSTRSVQTLSDVSYLLKLDQIRMDIEKMAVAVISMELIGQVLHENEVNEHLFTFMLTMLSWLNESKTISRLIFPYIQLRVIELIGIGLQKDNALETTSGMKGYINIESGSLSNKPKGKQALPLTEQQFAFAAETLQSKRTSLFKKKFTNSELSELIDYLDRYIRYHIEGVKPRNSDDIFDKILNH